MTVCVRAMRIHCTSISVADTVTDDRSYRQVFASVSSPDHPPRADTKRNLTGIIRTANRHTAGCTSSVSVVLPCRLSNIYNRLQFMIVATVCIYTICILMKLKL